jgi:hypothetical protein
MKVGLHDAKISYQCPVPKFSLVIQFFTNLIPWLHTTMTPSGIAFKPFHFIGVKEIKILLQ